VQDLETRQLASAITKTSGRKRAFVFLTIGLALSTVTILGCPYYSQDVATRVRSPLHAWFRSSGYVGQSLGILALAGFLFLWLYPIRKRVRKVALPGSVPGWLRVHIVVGLFLPWLVALHAGWRFTGLAGLAFWAMVVVWASGLVGKYLYGRIPRSRNGLELTLDEIASRHRQLVLEISAYTGWSPQEVEQATLGGVATDSASGVWGAIRRMTADDLARRRALRDLRRRWERSNPGSRTLDRKTWAEVGRLARQQMALEQQVRLLDATRKVFRYWHAAHLPVGLTALLAVVVHVAVVVAVGATWFH
jgi:hypothetical protein